MALSGAACTLFVSTFASSHLFTVIIMLGVYLIGHLQATARAYWLAQNGGDWLTHLFLALVALFFPDLQAFNLVDQVVAGAFIPLAFFLKTALLATVYTAIYLLFAAIVLNGKEL